MRRLVLALVLAASACASDDGAATSTAAVSTLAPTVVTTAAQAGGASPEAVARAYVEALNARDPDRLVGFFALPAEVRLSAEQPYTTVQTAASLRSMLASTPDCDHEIVSVAASGEDVAVSVVVSGASCPFPGNEIRITLRVVDGLIVRLG